MLQTHMHSRQSVAAQRHPERSAELRRQVCNIFGGEDACMSLPQDSELARLCPEHDLKVRRNHSTTCLYCAISCEIQSPVAFQLLWLWHWAVAFRFQHRLELVFCLTSILKPPILWLLRVA